MTFLRSSFCARPTTDSTTWPPLNRRSVGMPRTWDLNETFGLSSTLSLPTVTLPAYSVASAPTVGARRLQGPHHSAQKSTRTGAPDCSTSASKLLSVKFRTFSVGIRGVLSISLQLAPLQRSVLNRQRGAGHIF